MPRSVACAVVRDDPPEVFVAEDQETLNWVLALKLIASDERETDLRRLLLRFDLLRFDAVADFDAAAGIYRECRRAGVTPRGMVDCMIASVARRNGATLLAHDKDLRRVAQVVGIAVDGASPSA